MSLSAVTMPKARQGPKPRISECKHPVAKHRWRPGALVDRERGRLYILWCDDCSKLIRTGWKAPTAGRPGGPPTDS